jgi:hypothetical protein
MGSGYAGKGIGRVAGGADPALADYPGKREQHRQFGAPLPPMYDEYHGGAANVWGWLGQPVSGPLRFTSHLGPVIYRFGVDTPLPTMRAKDSAWQAGLPERRGDHGFRVSVEEVGLWRSRRQGFSLAAELPIPDVQFRQYNEYAISFRVHGTSPFRHLGMEYAAIPRNITLRLVVDGQIGDRSKVAFAGFIQEALVFEQEREVVLTLIAPADGSGILQICLSENRGTVVISDLTIREGCADVMARRFENGMVVLNGSSFTPVTVPLREAGSIRPYRRLQGTQDPDHNDGSPVGEQIAIPSGDAVFLRCP